MMVLLDFCLKRYVCLKCYFCFKCYGLLVLLLCSVNALAEEVVTPDEARQGVMHFNSWRIDLQPSVPLAGEWLFYPGQLLSLEDLSLLPIPGTQRFPAPLLQCSVSDDITVLSGTGQRAVATASPPDEMAFTGCTATYVLELRALPRQPLGIIIHELGTAFSLSWNGEEIARGGQVSEQAHLFVPYVGHRIAELPPVDGGGVLVLQVSNLVAAETVTRSLMLGDAATLRAEYAQGELLEALSASIAAIGGLLLLIQQKARRRYEKGLWGLSLFSFSVALYTVTEGYTVLSWLQSTPPDWAGVVRINIACQNLFVPSLVIWLASRYESMFPRWFTRPMLAQLLISVPVILALPLPWLLQFESPQMLGNLLLGLLAFGFLLRHRYQYSGQQMTGLWVTLLFVLISAVHDVLLYQRVIYGMDWLPMGFVCFIVGQIFLLALDRAKQHAQLEGLNHQLMASQALLERRVELRTKELKGKVDQLETVNDELRYLNRNDSLTGLLRQSSFLSACRDVLADPVAAQEPVSLILLDLDRYKHISAMFGPIAADQAMKDVASLLASWAGDRYICGRLEGESFALLVPQMDEDDAIREAEWLRMRISQRSIILENLSDSGQVFQVSASFGVSSFLWGDAEIQDMMDASESALNKAKKKGRNCVVGYRHLQTA